MPAPTQDAGGDASPPVVADEAPPVAAPPPAAPSSPVVRRAAPKIAQRARPRARGADGKFVSDLAGTKPTTPAPKASAAAKRSGARGGRGYYRSRVRGG